MARRPNILWLCTDQQRFDTITSLGNSHIRTPNIDKLASEGVTFTRAYSQSPVCTPSRAAFLTGRYPRTARCRQNGAQIPPDEILVTRLLAEDGYDCGLVGKLHLGPCRGFDGRTVGWTFLARSGVHREDPQGSAAVRSARPGPDT